MSSSLHLQQRPACLIHLIWMVLEMGGRWPYSCCFMGCCFQDLFITARSILVQLPSSYFSTRLVSVHVMHPYCSRNITAAWKKLHFILFYWTGLTSNMTDSQSIVVHAFACRILMSFSFDETLLPRYVNSSTSFRDLPFNVEMPPF